jgi:hypothetical protein
MRWRAFFQLLGTLTALVLLLVAVIVIAGKVIEGEAAGGDARLLLLCGAVALLGYWARRAGWGREPD